MSLLVPLSLSAIGATAAAGIFAHDFFEGETLLADLARVRRLSRMELAALDDRVARNSGRSAVVVTLTTIPSRIAHLGMTLKSLLDQSAPPAEIRLNIPHHSRRENCGYEIPAWLETLKTVHIVRCDDFGPATKLFPTLTAVDRDTPIVVVDDDRIYPASFLADLDRHASEDRDAAFGLSGWVVPADFTDRATTVRANLHMDPPVPIRARRLRAPRPIDILQGYSGYLVRPRFFPETEAMLAHRDAPEAAFFVDDVWISGFCTVPKFVIPARRAGFQQWSRKSLYRTSSLGRVNSGDGTPESRNNTIVIRHLADRWTVGGHRLAGSAPQDG
ncbi:hypothetical protein [Stappia stellulata]|uniref:hypothetical protein n=1 Tax=Stappia stellulata TaxID=71235 RepID=UPI0004920A0E|nr:hypothetical protein [Stappia stellulata]